MPICASHYARWGETLSIKMTVRKGDQIIHTDRQSRFIVQGEDDGQEVIEGVDPRTMCLRFYCLDRLEKDDLIVYQGKDYRIFKVLPQMQGCGYCYIAGAER